MRWIAELLSLQTVFGDVIASTPLVVEEKAATGIEQPLLSSKSGARKRSAKQSTAIAQPFACTHLVLYKG